MIQSNRTEEVQLRDFLKFNFGDFDYDGEI